MPKIKPDAGPRFNLESYGVLVRDKRLSHGAFRVWHCLRDYTDRASKCFPGQRRVARDIGCDIHSIRKWTAELVAAGWLKVQGGNGRRFDYTVLDGNGQPLRKGTTPTDAERHNGSVVEKHDTTVVENHHEPLRKGTTKVISPFNQVHLSKSKSHFKTGRVEIQ
jgi:hypothetical protein